MAELTIRSALDAIEVAINKDDCGDALAILQNAREVLIDSEESVAPPEQRMRVELDDAHLAMEEADSFISVCGLALSGDVDNEIARDVARVLDAVYDRLKAARQAMVNATGMLPEVDCG